MPVSMSVSLSMCMYVYMCICIWTRICICFCVRIRIQMFVYAYISRLIDVYLYTTSYIFALSVSRDLRTCAFGVLAAGDLGSLWDGMSLGCS